MDKLQIMRTLNLQKGRWMIREMQKQELSVWQIAKQQAVTPRWARELRSRFNTPKEFCLKRCGRKPQLLSEEQEQLVLSLHAEYKCGARSLENHARARGVRLSHNKIHAVLKKYGLAKNEPRKQKRRKWVRYERRHSNSLWHTDWSEINGKQVLVIEDDASRFIVGYGEFTNANAENTRKVFAQAFALHGLPKQVISDHGTQFVNVQDETGEHVFTEWLKGLGVQPIYARVKHPQTNGKIERLFQTLGKDWKWLGSLEKAVQFYNFKRPHMSLRWEKLETPAMAFKRKKRKY